MGYTTTIRSKRQRIVTALDVGTSKICCLIAKTSPAPDWFEGKGDAVQFEVLGFDHHRAEGLKAGMITHLDSAEHCIRSAVDAAERMAGVTVEDVHVAVTCGRLKSESFSASVALPSGAVREDDIMRLLAGGRQYAGRDKRTVLHALPIELSPRRQWRHQRAAWHVRRAACRRPPRRHRRRGGDAQSHALRRALPSRRREPGRRALCERALGRHARRGQARRRLHRFRRRHHHALGVRRRPFHPRRRHRARRQRHHHRHRPRALPRRSITPSGSRRCTAAPSPRSSDEREIITYPSVGGMAQRKLEPDHQGAARRHHPPAHRGDPRSDAPAACGERARPPRSPSISC